MKREVEGVKASLPTSIDVDAVIEELRHTENLFKTAPTEEARVFVLMRFASIGKGLFELANGMSVEKTRACLERLNPVVQ